MKNKIWAIILGFVALCGALPAQTVSLNFESGNRSLDASHCWDVSTLGYTNKNPLSGRYSAITDKLNSGSDPFLNYLKSPWVVLREGNVSFSVALSNQPATERSIEVAVIPYSASASAKEGSREVIYTYEYATPRESQIRNFSVPLPAKYLSGASACRVIISFLGTGGSGYAYLDNVVVPGTYHSDPSNNCLPLQPPTDADGDGVDNDKEAYPNDPHRAYNNYFPSETGYATLLFEDKWPGKGDYDFNDLVMNYRINSVTNAAGQVVEQKYTYVIRAIGAWYRNGFGFQLTGVNPASIRAVSGTRMSGEPYPVPDTEYITEYSFQPNGLESGQTRPTVIVFDDAFKVMGTENVLMNTDKTLPYVNPQTLNVTVTFMEDGVPGSGGAVQLSQLTNALFNPFLVINGDRRREVHLPHYRPTDLAVTTVFGMIDDASVPAEGTYYVTRQNHPWVLNIPYEIPYTRELLQIDTGFLKFIDWVVSGGALYGDWYLDKPGYRNSSALY